jgi:hypothetical protein
MKKVLLHPALAFVLVVFVLSLFVFLPGIQAQYSTRKPVADSWSKIGERKIESNESDIIPVSSSNGAFTAIKIIAKKGGINLHRCLVEFKNGEKRSVEMRNDIPAGNESRIIPLPGTGGAIEKVTLWYDTRNYPNQKPEVELWGRN